MAGMKLLARRAGAVVALIAATTTLSTGPAASAAPAGGGHVGPGLVADRSADVTEATAGTSPEGVESSAPRIMANNPIDRAEVRKRAQTWIDEQVPYSQSLYHSNQYGTYRQDCSGYVSMAWGMDNSYTTYSLQPFMDTISRSDLRPGDVLWRHDTAVQHIALFMGWADTAQTRPVVWEEYDYGHFAEQRVWAQSWADTFVPKRYKNIVETPSSRADLVRIEADGSLTGWWNSNAFAGQWNAPAGIGGVGSTDHTRLRFGDLDGDSRDDLVRIEADGTLTAWRNNNAFAGQWSAPATIGGVGSTDHTRLRLADLDGDKRDDLVRVEADGTLTAWRNNNALAGQWGAPGTIGGVGSTDHTRLRFGDLDGDNRDDLIRVEADGLLTAWWNHNALAGQWNSPVIIGGVGTTDHTRIEFADLDGDNRADAIRAEANGTLTAWWNNNAFAGQWNSPTNIGGVGTTDHTRLRYPDLD
ncbi:FG-GAP-like repeat-containing protein [Actinosynnema sp. NPDC050436]|uniref:C40 family peptidase n=1 Tax=Actinosynnema sp. NPDC050436 TaxID=3155659 RepID=UPI0033D5ACB2